MDTRTRILNEALRLFATHGYDAVGVQTIVEAAEVTKPTLYHHFGSKRKLFETLVTEKGEPLLIALRQAAAYHHDITRSIQQVVHTCFTFAGEQPMFYRLLLATWFAPPSSEYFGSVQHLLHQQYLLLEGLFLAAVPDHVNMQGRHHQYAVSLKGIIDTYIGMALQGVLDLNADHLEYRVVHQFMHGIFS